MERFSKTPNISVSEFLFNVAVFVVIEIMVVMIMIIPSQQLIPVRLQYLEAHEKQSQRRGKKK